MLSPGIRTVFTLHSGIRFVPAGDGARLRLVRYRGNDAPAEALTPGISRPHTDEAFTLVPGRNR